ncbi:MAG: class I SAM-dependent methyltransferase [Planctomycetota bacterium]|jgi:23S rRNA (cytosine1962-C5)-methyltransferase
MLGNRLKKRYRHLRKWARRTGVTCFRLYERDIPEFPLIVDWYDGEAVVWYFRRKRDETEAQARAWLDRCIEEIGSGLALEEEQIFIKERRRQRGTGQYERLSRKGHVRKVEEQGLLFEVNLSDYLDTGLFLDHRNTRAMVRVRSGGKRMLNLFAYTGSFTCYARAGGAASTITVDLSNTYCDWTGRNLLLNGFDSSPDHRLVRADCLEYLVHDAREAAPFDLIVCDPPTFSNSKAMQRRSFALDRDCPELLRLLKDLLAPGGELFFSTNSRSLHMREETIPQGLSIEEISQVTVPQDFRNKKIHRCWILTRR